MRGRSRKFVWLEDLCRCGHKRREHDFGAANRRPCKFSCPCKNFHMKKSKV